MSEVQSIVFPKENYTLKQARQWLKDNKYKSSKVDEKTKTWRFRQFNPSKFTNYRSKKVGDGIILVIGFDD